MTDLSVIVVSWNSKRYLQDCLAALPAGAGDISYEVFVIDNGSTDGSAALVHEAFPGVSLISNPQNRGFAAANNQGLRIARGRYALLLNPDTRVEPLALSQVVRFMDAHPEAGACGCMLVDEGGAVQHAVRRFPTFRSALASKTILGNAGLFRKSYDRVKMRDVTLDEVMEVDQPSGAALFLRRNALEKAGLLDEGFFIFFEEVDLCRRIKMAGYKIYFFPDARIVHYGGRSRRQIRAAIMTANAQSMLRYFRKYPGGLKSAVFEAFFRPLFVFGIITDACAAAIKVGFYSLQPRCDTKREAKRELLGAYCAFIKTDFIKFLLCLGE